MLDSLCRQVRQPDEVLVIDASDDGRSEDVVQGFAGARSVAYWRVVPPLKGLTRQRNFSLTLAAFDLIAFFDDDVLLEPRCLAELERVLRARPDVVGAGCLAETFLAPSALWRVRRALGMLSESKPGAYTRSGMSIPWRFHPPTEDVLEGDWLPGCAMMVRSEAASATRFDEEFSGYGQAEDLDFSLRLRSLGRLVVAGAARCAHLHEPAGRPDARQLGHMEIWNRYRIWQRTFGSAGPSARWMFVYAWTVDTIMLTRDAIRPSRAFDGVMRIAGRVSAARRILATRTTR
jgi:GT2 family glycosyltransferase